MSLANKADWISQRIRLTVGQRLLLGLAPSLLAIALVLAMAYYGEIGREAPEYVVAGSALLALVSLLLTWSNTRYLVGRLRRLGRSDRVGEVQSNGNDSSDDDLDRIEGTVARLTVSLEGARADAHQLEQRLQEQATMLSATVRGIAAQVDEVRLPLHILLDARFGEVNENQEELLVSARAGADAMDASLRRLATVGDADREALTPRLEPVSLNDTMRAVLPMVRASADRRGVRVVLQLEPALPSVWANRSALAEAIALLVTRAVGARSSGDTLTIETLAQRAQCVLRISPATLDFSSDALSIVAERILRAQGATIRQEGASAEIASPRTTASTRL